MFIKNHRLVGDDDVPVRYEDSKKFSKNRTIKPAYLIVHYTASENFAGDVRVLSTGDRQVSVQLAIGPAGEIAQIMPFNRRAWHAGRSAWKGINDINSHSIGIELTNIGWLDRHDENGWFRINSSGVPETRTIPEDELIRATHRSEAREIMWQPYPQAQLDALWTITTALHAKYSLAEILGHDDIAPGRKTDPGPAFPMEELRDHIYGEAFEFRDLVETTTNLNIRTGPGTEFNKLPESPLAVGTKLQRHDFTDQWTQASVLDQAGAPLIDGWVFNAHIRPVGSG